MKTKMHPRSRIALVALASLLLLFGILLIRSPEVGRDNQSVAGGAEPARPPKSTTTTQDDLSPSGNSGDTSSRDSAIKSPGDAAATLSSGKPGNGAVPGASFTADEGIPKYADPEDWVKTELPCWGLRGTAPKDFVVAADQRVLTTGTSSASIEAARPTSGWGTLYQFANAKDLRGKRIEFSADIRTAGVALGASIFVRADDAKGASVALDNMWFSYGEDRKGAAILNRSLSGDNEWTTEHVVLDIPSEASAISYGAILEGSGKVWIDNAHLEIVGSATPTTAIARSATMLQQPPFPLTGQPTSPRNLGFERDGLDGKCD